jgi:hypothetical protein
MPASHRLAALALVVACLAPAVLAPASANTMDDLVAAISSGPTQLGLCGDGDAPLKPAACKEGGLDTLAAQIDKVFAATLAKAPVNVRPLLKRDQVWFGEIVVNAAESMPQSDNADDRQAFVASLRQRGRHAGSDRRRTRPLWNCGTVGECIRQRGCDAGARRGVPDRDRDARRLWNGR